MNNTKKMYRANSLVRGWLALNGYVDVHFFPHTRFIKDWHFQGQDFDGIASKGTKLVLFQCKTNCRATKKSLVEYKTLEKKFSIECIWFNLNTKVRPMELEVNNEMPVS